ncbi:MAG: hydantoinase/oxoprolinase family protein [Chloroflexi bacterium]|nr:hydantoinase/oxoprolinase family protein [Chloroflexota bacterium]
MTIALGIDTGGTYTDAVLVDHASGEVLSGDKALTTRHDLSIGIGQAVAAVFEGNGVSPAKVDFVALSTTLATNAIVEGRGGPVCLLLIGYDPVLIQQYGFERDLVTQDVVYLRGGHDGLGNEVEPLDEAAVRDAILARRERVDAFAVSGYFGVRNPAHELRVRALVDELTGLPVTCGHELTTRLNAVRRATTTALNARLIPLLRDLISTVRRALDEQAITAPLMVVKGDGSLVRAEWAMKRPIETILSGPAASVVGAWHLAGRRDVWVVDVGGTTTDIAVLHDGRPRLNPEGARVGQWQTMIEAVDVHTVGQGGDSLVRLDGNRQLTIGPRRVVPLCLLASEHSGIVDELQRQIARDRKDSLTGQFALAQRQTFHGLADEERGLLEHLAPGPKSLDFLADKLRYRSVVERQVKELETRGLVLRAGFTPTDALHVLGRFERWDVEASRIGAELLVAQLDLSPEVFCERVVAGVSNRVVRELVSKVLNDEVTLPNWAQEPAATALLDRALGNALDSDLDCQLKLRQPLVAVGAPVKAYIPRVAQRLHTELIIPRRAEVGNAVGAVAGSVVQQLRATIRPFDGELGFRLLLPDGVCDFDTLEEAVAHAQQVVPEQLRALARQAGAGQVEAKVERVDRRASVKMGYGQDVYLGTDLIFTAVGRPSPAQSM